MVSSGWAQQWVREAIGGAAPARTVPEITFEFGGSAVHVSGAGARIALIELPGAEELEGDRDGGGA